MTANMDPVLRRPKKERRTQKEKSEEMRARLRRATIEILMEKGFQNAGTPDICRRAGVSRGAMLHHYPSKNDLLIDAANELWKVVPKRLEELAGALQRGEIDVDGFVEGAWSKMFADDVVLPSLELTFGARCDPNLAEPIAAGLRGIFDSYNDYLHAAFVEKGWCDEQIPDAINLVLCALRGLKLQSLAYQSPKNIEEVKTSLKQALKRVLTARD